ncbi:hypothetical protein [Azospirillum palustre]|uniref:hypothetical protein n=1 Tax=Azospirillum palustre TaxID=2044885 RepID=UPI001958D5C0|nr:hypothetical protein [Azospirillum palustre]
MASICKAVIGATFISLIMVELLSPRISLARGGGGHGGSVSVHGYTRGNGTYVAPHMRSAPNGTALDNWSTQGNINPYTGEPGHKKPNGNVSTVDPSYGDSIGIIPHISNVQAPPYVPITTCIGGDQNKVSVRGEVLRELHKNQIGQNIYAYLLILKTSICLYASDNYNNTVQKQNQISIQLVGRFDSRFREYLIEKDVIVTGSLKTANSPLHFTEVVIDVETLTVYDKAGIPQASASAPIPIIPPVAAPSPAIVASPTSAPIQAPVPQSTGHSARKFNCKKATLPVDFVICSDPALIALVDDLQSAWEELRSSTSSARWPDALAAQRAWIKTYPLTCGVPEKGKPALEIIEATKPCVAAYISDRIRLLNKDGVKGLLAGVDAGFLD